MRVINAILRAWPWAPAPKPAASPCTSFVRLFCAAIATSLCLAQSSTESGIAAFRDGRYPDAARLLESAVSRNPHDEHARAFLALTRAGLGRCAEAIPDLSSEFTNSGDADLSRLAGIALAQCYIATGDTAKAAPVAAQLESKYPADADVLYEAARVHMQAFNDITRRMFEKTPASYRVNELSAEIFETQGRYGEAAAEYRKAIAKNARALGLHFRLGRAILLDSHAPDALAQAEREFEAELALNPTDAAAEFQIGQILSAQNRQADALKRFERALDLSPDFPEAALAVGRARLQEKRYADAVPLLERVVAAQPDNEAAHYNLMLAYRDSGQMDKARREQQKVNALRRPAGGEFSDFLKKLGEKPPPAGETNVK